MRSAYGHAQAVVQRWQVSKQDAFQRADRYLKQIIKRLSRTRAATIIEKGDFRSSSRVLKPSSRVGEGEWVELWRFPPDEPQVLDVVQIPIIAEDTHLLVIDKPGYLAVHPSARYLYQTVTHWLRQKDPACKTHPCHRLDRETSGVLVCAKTREAQSVIKIAFQKGAVQKTYLAIVHGHVRTALDIDWPLRLQGEEGLVAIKMVRDDKKGLLSQTWVEPLKYDSKSQLSLVRCIPKTGRQHQIRAHLAGEGYPIVGDKLYAMGQVYFDRFTKGLEANQSRQALHAETVQFELFGEKRFFKAPLPHDILVLMANME